MAEDLHQRERTIKGARGRIIDTNGVVIADNRTGLYTFRHLQPGNGPGSMVIQVLCDELAWMRSWCRKRVENAVPGKS